MLAACYNYSQSNTHVVTLEYSENSLQIHLKPCEERGMLFLITVQDVQSVCDATRTNTSSGLWVKAHQYPSHRHRHPHHRLHSHSLMFQSW